MRNHELVPGTLVNSIASLRLGGCGKILVDLTKHKLLGFERGKRFDGYRLTYSGYDYLALNVLTHREVLGGVGNQIGVGKESDVFICESPDQQKHYAIKFHRLGRVCFRKVSQKRDFYTKSKNKTSWIYLSRLAAQREFQFLKLMHSKGMPVPEPIDANRHVVVMELIDGRILNQYAMESFEPEKRDSQVAALYKNLMDLLLRFANELRLIHGDFNEFNILIRNNLEKNELEPVIIDFPQMIPVDHELAPEQFERDVDCIVDFFNKRFHFESDYAPRWSDVEDPEDGPEKDTFSLEALKIIDEDEEECRKLHLHKSLDLAADITQPGDRLADEESEGTLSNQDNDDQSDSENKLIDDIDDCLSQAITVDPEEARRRIKAEMMKRENNRKKRNASKLKNIKGDANPVRRRRKNNNQNVCEDIDSFNSVW